MFEPSANCECVMGSDIGDEPQMFGYEFEPKGNFSFTFKGASLDADFAVLCSPFLFTVKELVRRTQYSAITKFAESLTTQSVINGLTAGPYISMESLLFLSDNFAVSENVLSFVTLTPYMRVEPMVSIIGSRYPYKNSDSPLSVFKIYDHYVWTGFPFSILIISLIISIEIYPGITIVKYSNNIWNMIKMGYLGTRSARVDRMSNAVINSVNIWMAFTLLSAFSSSILSTLINIPFTLINSVDDLKDRPDLTHFVHYSYEGMNLIRKFGTKEEIELLETGLRNTPSELVTDELKLFNVVNQMKKIIIKDKTHVIISNLGHSKLIQTSVIGHKSSHISTEHSLYVLEGCVHSKYLDHFVAQKYQDILYDLLETGLYPKWISNIMEKAAEVYKVKDPNESDVSEHKDFKLKIAPAMGPLAIGITISFITFLFEKVLPSFS